MHEATSLQELKEETSQLCVTSSCLEEGGSSVRKNVKMEIFSLKRIRSQLREADTASNIKKDFIQHRIQF